MLQTQVNYWNLVENRRHNYEQEAIGRAQADAQLRTANANLQNAVSNAVIAQANWQNAQTNAFTANYQKDLGYKNLSLSEARTASDVALNAAYVRQAGAETAKTSASKRKIEEETKFVPLTALTQADYYSSLTGKTKHDIIAGYINAGSNAIGSIGSALPVKFNFGF